MWSYSDTLADAEFDSTEINACDGGGGGALTVSVTICTAVDSLSVETAAADWNWEQLLFPSLSLGDLVLSVELYA